MKFSSGISRYVKILLFTFFLLASAYVIYYMSKSTGNTLTELSTLSVISKITTNSKNVSDNNAQNPTSLKVVVGKILTGSLGIYGIVIKNLKTGESYYLNEHKTFEAGSLYKLWVMAEVYKEIQEGTLREDDVLSQDVATLNYEFNIDPNLAEQTEGTVTFTVHDALNQMITISDNYAALLLTEKIKLSSVATFIQDNGFNESTVGTDGSSPTFTPSDIALFFEKLYNGQLANKQYTNEMVDLLKNQQLNGEIPKLLPENTQIAHKTGEIDTSIHDAGIVYVPSGNYIIAILSDSGSSDNAQDLIPNISKAVFDYFSKK